ncbi:MAG TPA: PhzF family phenazine biosynthesis protein, partial [Flavisolibacter sp.]|nr:PhzF family phenazine biosynthesis protein [Flavisolibacter sp.]
MTLTIYQVDAFTDVLFSGNPAAVIPLAGWLEDSLMQKIAMENNLSETVFFVKDSSAGAGFYSIRWFTPEFEIDLCGHATLASAFIIKKFIEPGVHQISFSTQKAGDLKVYVENDVYTLDFPARIPVACEAPEELFKSLGITTSEAVLRSRDYFVVLPDEAAVLACTPDYNAMKELDAIGVIVTAKGDDLDVVSRCFYPGAGIPEDPVTGSAHCNIVPYWSEKLGMQNLVCKQASPRSGILRCEAKGDRVLMS